MQTEEEYIIQLQLWIDGSHKNPVIDRYFADFLKANPEASKEDFKSYILKALFHSEVAKDT